LTLYLNDSMRCFMISFELKNAFLKLFRSNSLVTGCASKYIRELAKPIVQVAAAIPLFAITKKGKELVIEREKDIESPILITVTELPIVPKHKQPRELK